MTVLRHVFSPSTSAGSGETFDGADGVSDGRSENTSSSCPRVVAAAIRPLRSSKSTTVSRPSEKCCDSAASACSRSAVPMRISGTSDSREAYCPNSTVRAPRIREARTVGSGGLPTETSLQLGENRAPA